MTGKTRVENIHIHDFVLPSIFRRSGKLHLMEAEPILQMDYEH